MPSPTPERNKHSQPLQQAADAALPLSSERLCLDALNQRMIEIVKRAAELLTAELDRPNLTLTMNGRPVDSNGAVAQGFAQVTGIYQSSLTHQEREARINALINEKTERLLISPPAIVPDFTAFIRSFGITIAEKSGEAGFSPIAIKEQSEQRLRELLRNEVARLTREKFDLLAQSSQVNPTAPSFRPLPQQVSTPHRQQRVQLSEEQKVAQRMQEELSEFLRPNVALNAADIRKWVEIGLNFAADPERLATKLKGTGLVDYGLRKKVDLDTGKETATYSIYSGKTGSSYFKSLRAWSFGAWGATLAASGLLLTAASPGALGLGVALGVICVINAGNLGFQTLLKKLHTNAFENSWKSIQNELNTVEPTRIPALTGLMYLLVDKYSPIILFKNQTQLGRWGEPLSTDTVLDRLKEASVAALENLGRTTGDYMRVTDTERRLRSFKNGLDDLEKRWNWHWGASTWWGSTLTSLTFLGAAGYLATALG